MIPVQAVVALVSSLSVLSAVGKEGVAVALRHLCSAARPGVRPTRANADKGVMVRGGCLPPVGLGDHHSHGLSAQHHSSYFVAGRGCSSCLSVCLYGVQPPTPCALHPSNVTAAASLPQAEIICAINPKPESIYPRRLRSSTRTGCWI